MKPLYLLLLPAAMLLLATAACTTTKLAATDLEKVKTQAPPGDKALVYILRPSFSSYAVTFSVRCDGKPAGSNGAKRFIYMVLDPGVHKFESRAENNVELFLETEPGKTYFLEQQPAMGLLYSRNHMRVISSEEGRRKLKACKLSGDCPTCVP